MPSSDMKQPVQLQVQANNPATEIFVIDGNFTRVGKGLGQLAIDLSPGLYKVKFKTGSQIEEHFVTLAPGKEKVQVRSDEPLQTTSLPLKKQSYIKSFQQVNPFIAEAEKQSKRIHLDIGNGSQLFIFVHDDIERKINVARGLSLHDQDGKQVASISKQGVSNLAEKWAACNISLKPGQYRLRLQTKVIGRLEQTISTHDGWQTHVFLGNRSYTRSVVQKANRYARRADLPNASILMTRLGEGFDARRDDLRWMESARLGLQGNRPVANAGEMRNLLYEKFQNPILGIFGAHLLLLEPELKLDLLNTVVENLFNILGPQPDVQALRLHLHHLEKRPCDPMPVSSVPPMLLASWKILLALSADYPGLIPYGSLAGRVATELWGDGVWLTWQLQDDGQQLFEVDEDEPESLYPSFREIYDRLEKETDLNQILLDKKLNQLEESVVQYITHLLPTSFEKAQLTQDDDPDEESLSKLFRSNVNDEVLKSHFADQQVVQSLRVPRSVASQAAASISKKMLKG